MVLQNKNREWGLLLDAYTTHRWRIYEGLAEVFRTYLICEIRCNLYKFHKIYICRCWQVYEEFLFIWSFTIWLIQNKILQFVIIFYASIERCMYIYRLCWLDDIKMQAYSWTCFSWGGIFRYWISCLLA